MNLTIKNIPRAVYDRLKQNAERNRRSLNSEVILRLEESMGLRPRDPHAILEAAARVRALYRGPPITEEELRAWKEEGRA